MPSSIIEQILDNVEKGAVLPSSSSLTPTRDPGVEISAMVEATLNTILDEATRFTTTSKVSPDLLAQQFALALREGMLDEPLTEDVSRRRAPRPQDEPSEPRHGECHEESAVREIECQQ